MHYVFTTSLVLFSLCVVSSSKAQEDWLYETPEKAAQDEDFSIQGEYVGPERAMQVVALGDGEFEAVVYSAGLPGAGWDGAEPQRMELDADQVTEVVQANQMQPTTRRSPTLGLKPPAGAVVLFDGSPESLRKHWQPGSKLVEGGLLAEGATTRANFHSYTLHLEFRIPFRPHADGQRRGNSGVYHQGCYETQILDSFGLHGTANETGGIYSVRDPDLNMCFPPLTWQTYDIDLTAAQFDISGKKTANAKITVRLNGVVVQQDIPLSGTTPAAPTKESPNGGPLHLQDHANPVRFRNIWIKPRDIEKEARRPIVPSFERFRISRVEDPHIGGRLLIGELGCIACHRSSSQQISHKQAPILDNVGSRIRPEYLLKFIQNPHATKPGTTMPIMLTDLTADQQLTAAKSITHYLMSTGTPVNRYGGRPQAADRGKQIFHSIGCTACHLPESQDQPISTAISVPLGPLGDKYTLDSLSGFLQDPHSVRPSGRMPSFSLDKKQAVDVATYLLRDVVLGENYKNVKAKFSKGSWQELPDFDALDPDRTLTTFGFDIHPFAEMPKERFAVRFDTFFIAPKDALYRFHLGSDDGSRLLIDGKQVIDNDGIHSMEWKVGQIRLAAGSHTIGVEFFELEGEESLKLDVEGGGLSRTPLDVLAVLDDQEDAMNLTLSNAQINPALVEKGKQLFVGAGCAACHQLHQDKDSIQSQTEELPLEQLNGQQGCLAEQVPRGLPDYELSDAQRSSIQAALASIREGKRSLTKTEQIHSTMLSMNCYACHNRGGIGGPEKFRDSLFKTTMREMGDEGRLPPSLDGVGDKLKETYLRNTLKKGSDERPYMLVTMPGFGSNNLKHLADLLIHLDRKKDVDIQRATGSTVQVKSNGRFLAGAEGLSCSKCHTVGGKGTGILAMDMQRMTTRLRENWFHRYLMSPRTYRPGTRMPDSFPDGKSMIPLLYDGKPSQQIDALWQYFLEGSRMRPPSQGIKNSSTTIIASEHPVMYRNFIDGLSPRGIGVGYPEGVNLGWDVNAMALKLLWKGPFMDGSRHWVDRGQGFQAPLGHQLIVFEPTASVATLDSLDAPWPGELARERGYRFLGYRLNQQGQPTFRYRFRKVVVEDTPLPGSDNDSVFFRRQLKLDGDVDSVVWRIAQGKKIDPQGNGFRMDDTYSIKVSGAQPHLIKNKDGVELRARIPLSEGPVECIQTIQW